MLRWTRIENGTYMASGFRIRTADEGGWTLTLDGKVMGKFRTAADAKAQAERWLRSR